MLKWASKHPVAALEQDTVSRCLPKQHAKATDGQMDVKTSFEYACLDHTILVRDGGTVSWELIWFLHVSTGLWVVSDVGFKRKKISRVRNRLGTYGNAIGIFSICGRVAALGYVISESCAAVCGSF